MKKVILILGVFLVLGGCTKTTDDLPAPADSEALGSVAKPNNIWTEVMDPFTGYYSIPLECDGVAAGVLEGRVSVFCRMLWKGSGLEWMIMEFTGQLRGSDGEVFDVKDTRKYNAAGETFNAHIKGDRGSHYILSGNITYEPFALTIRKAVCPPRSE